MNKVLGLLTIVAVIGAITLLNTKTEFGTHMRQGQNLDTEFAKWQIQFGKQYKSETEQMYRKKIWLATYRKIQAHNADTTQTYTMGINQFSDLTALEFRTQYLALKSVDTKQQIINDDMSEMLPQDVNWVTAGAVTPIKNQGQCGSCWAFSTTGGLEGVSKIWGGALQSFSEQQLVSCSSSYGNNGCNGGLMDYAFQYVMAHGIQTEAQYPYTSGNGVTGTCKSNSGSFKISGYTNVPSGSCSTLITACNTQPVSVGVDATNWPNYSGGIFSNCGTQLDHGVLLAGYVTNQYLLVKNSWGTSWGEAGYIRLKWGNTCGICNTASTPKPTKE